MYWRHEESFVMLSSEHPPLTPSLTKGSERYTDDSYGIERHWI